MTLIYRCTIVVLVMLSTDLMAQIPVMNTLPRWDYGYGLQYRYEYQELQNPTFQQRHSFSFEGVVSIVKEIRLFARLPVSTLVSSDASNLLGLDKSELGFIGKYYWNQQGIAASAGGLAAIVFPSVNVEPLQKYFGLQLGAMADFETYYWLVTAEYSFAYFPQTLLIEHNLYPNVGYHIFHYNDLNLGTWLLIGLDFKHLTLQNGGRMPTLLLSEQGTNMHISFGTMAYIDNILLRIDYFMPIYSFRKAVDLNQVRIRGTLGAAFVYL